MDDSQKNQTGITIVGLGPGDADLITRHAWRVLENSHEVYLRTRQHPAVDQLPVHLAKYSFDDLYERAETFEEVYSAIVDKVLELGRRPQGVIYAVPGHPFVAEATAPEITRRARMEGLSVHVIEGMSFLEPVMSALGIDPFPHATLIDALELLRAHIPPFPPSAPAIIAQLHSRAVASEVKLTLNTIYPDEHPVKLVHGSGTSQEFVEEMPLYEIDRSHHIGLLTTLFLPPLGEETSFEAFEEVIAHLRAPDGCPWDREQTHLSLRSYLIEEAYEALAALDAEDTQALLEELGDLLLQVVLHAQIASEDGAFTMVDVLRSINKKIVYRHPHVFGDLNLEDSDSVLKNWELLKAQEREANGKSASSLLDGVALALPALSQAEQYQLRAARVGFDWQEIQGGIDKIHEELGEVLGAPDEGNRIHEIGDLLFAVVNLARWYKIDPESALRQANQRFRQRFGFIEQGAREQGRSMTDLSLDEMESFWQASKKRSLK